MRILVLTGIKEELTGILGTGFHWDPDTRLYRSLQLPDLFAGTTGPGLRKKKKDLRKAIERAAPNVIINGGLVGTLTEEKVHQVGDRLRLGEVIDSKSGIIYPGGRGHERLVTVGTPVFQPLEKMNLHLDTKADVCDMEAAPLLDLLGQMNEKLPELYVIFCKVVGDRPEDYNLFEKEEFLRGWEQKSTAAKMGIFLKHPRDAMRLLRLHQHKKKALASLTGQLGGLIRRLHRMNRVGEELDSVFIPH